MHCNCSHTKVWCLQGEFLKSSTLIGKPHDKLLKMVENLFISSKSTPSIWKLISECLKKRRATFPVYDVPLSWPRLVNLQAMSFFKFILNIFLFLLEKLFFMYTFPLSKTTFNLSVHFYQGAKFFRFKLEYICI